MRALATPFLFFTLLLIASCRPSAPETVPLPTKICVQTLHHDLPIPQSTVYLKYFCDTFPGYDKPAEYFDASFVTGDDARGCIESVPEGHHWIVAHGYDSQHYPYDNYGSLPVDISLDGRAVLDTVLYLAH